MLTAVLVILFCMISTFLVLNSPRYYSMI